MATQPATLVGVLAALGLPVLPFDELLQEYDRVPPMQLDLSEQPASEPVQLRSTPRLPSELRTAIRNVSSELNSALFRSLDEDIDSTMRRLAGERVQQLSVQLSTLLWAAGISDERPY